jgi:hypothetical protein
LDTHDKDHGAIFEDLYLLRASYRYRSDYDTRGTMSVPEAIAYGEQLLHRTSFRDQWRGFGQTHRAA